MERRDFVTINYVARVKDTMEVFDTTIEDVARQEGIHTENAAFGPVTIVMGAGHVIRGLEKALLTMEVGEEKEVDINPEEAFGKRNRSQITTVLLREFKKRGVFPRVGMRMEINNKWATVRSISSGRVILDFNHPLSGKVLHYSVQILNKVEEPRDKIKALLTIMGIRGKVTPQEDQFAIELQDVKRGKEKRVQNLVKREVRKYVPEAKISFSFS